MLTGKRANFDGHAVLINHMIDPFQIVDSFSDLSFRGETIFLSQT